MSITSCFAHTQYTVTAEVNAETGSELVYEEPPGTIPRHVYTPSPRDANFTYELEDCPAYGVVA